MAKAPARPLHHQRFRAGAFFVAIISRLIFVTSVHKSRQPPLYPLAKRAPMQYNQSGMISFHMRNFQHEE